MRHRCLNGAIIDTGSSIAVEHVGLTLSRDDAWALCNLLTDSSLDRNRCALEDEQVEVLRKIGVDLGKLIDHPSRGAWDADKGNKPAKDGAP